MIPTGLDVSGLTLLKFEPGSGHNDAAQATVFASPTGLAKLRKKILDFETKVVSKPDGTIAPPANAPLVQSIGAIVEAGLRALWRSPPDRFPMAPGVHIWELWLDRLSADAFVANAAEMNVAISQDRLEFPEDIVVIAHATRENLALAVRRLTGVRALAASSTTAEFFDDLAADDQRPWLENLVARVSYADQEVTHRVTLMDRGVSLAHPLISPALSLSDRHAADFGWDLGDAAGHGTRLAGLALYGDLQTALQSTTEVIVRHRLESVKIIPDAGENPHHLLGVMTMRGIDAAEAEGPRHRTFTLATTTDADTPHDGAPTSWSSELDQLAAGVSGQIEQARLLLVSAGNTDQNLFGHGDYLAVCDQAENEIESPAQAWNAVCIGAYTEKMALPTGTLGSPIAPFGDLSPSSRTASWASHWPIKPDVVFEGGNWVSENVPPPMKHQALSLLTTDHSYPLRAFTTVGETSAATALAARAVTDLWVDYPEFWPETIRALFVSSARWTDQMRSHVPANPSKGDYERLFRRYGFGVPDMDRARRSASNAITLIAQDTIVPYKKSATKGADHISNEMKVFNLPWPTDELRRLGNTVVTLRVGLSSFIRPNPSEPARGSKFRYASHNLRFKLQRINENDAQFLARVGRASDEPDASGPADEDGWLFGRNRRDVGSLQIDQLSCRASDLARRNFIAVHPVMGWWKSKQWHDPELRSVRFALVVEIDASSAVADLYAEVESKVKLLNAVQTVV